MKKIYIKYFNTNDNNIKQIPKEKYNNDNFIENEELSSVVNSRIKQWLHWKDLSSIYYLIHKYNLSLNINAKKLYVSVESKDNIPEIEYKKDYGEF